jgi:hypothetical protein
MRLSGRLTAAKVDHKLNTLQLQPLYVEVKPGTLTKAEGIITGEVWIPRPRKHRRSSRTKKHHRSPSRYRNESLCQKTIKLENFVEKPEPWTSELNGTHVTIT